MSDDDFELIRGSGNVYADFGYPDADVRLAKLRMESWNGPAPVFYRYGGIVTYKVEDLDAYANQHKAEMRV